MHRYLLVACVFFCVLMAFYGCKVADQQVGYVQEEDQEGASDRQPQCEQAANPAGQMSKAGLPPSTALTQARAIFGKLPDTMPCSGKDTPEKIALGKMLYFEKALSLNETISCNTCHRIDDNRGGVDNLKSSLGAKGVPEKRNAPTSLNAGFQISQFWDGRAPNLCAQAEAPPLNKHEMAMPTALSITKRLEGKKKYQEAFPKAYPNAKNPISFSNMAHAIAAFERTLITPAAFDDFVEGNESALTDGEKKGMSLVIDAGCVRCHNGYLMGGMMYAKVGIRHPYDGPDLGRFEQTHKESDKYVFKVPMWRNIGITAPYFSEGEVATLAEAIDLMGWHQLDRQFGNEEIEAILKFMGALGGTCRTTAPPTKQTGQTQGWNPPQLSDVPTDTDQGKLIHRGAELIARTYEILGAGAKPQQAYAGNVLACANCHLENGTKQFGLPLMGAAQRYPRYSAKAGKQISLEDRINGCIKRNHNGRPLPADSPEMKAMVAYIRWLGEGTPKDLIGHILPNFEYPGKAASVTKGEEVYLIKCQTCHGIDGTGYRARKQGLSGEFTVPPLWGRESYTIGAGMARLLTLGAFVRGNMPLGVSWQRPGLDADAAFNVAGFVESHDRPNFPGKENDWQANLLKKPADCPYPPYALDFPQDQHKYGPFQPIIQAQKNALQNQQQSDQQKQQ